MTIGPLQLVLITIDDEQRSLPISQELRAARRKHIIRLLDMLYLTKDMDGNIQFKEITDLSDVQKVEYGMFLKGLLSMRAAYNTNADADQVAEAFSLAENNFGINNEQIQKVAEVVPNGGSAILALFEHTWALQLKEAIINAGGHLITQGLLDPSVLALGGTTLEDALVAANAIEQQAEQAAQAELIQAEQALEDAHEQAAAKKAEAERILADAAHKMEQAKIIAAANIAASVRVASGELEEADEILDASKLAAQQEIAMGAEIAALEVQAGASVADQIIADGEAQAITEVRAGIQTAEEIKAAAALEAVKLLLQAELIKEEVTDQAVAMLVSAALIKQSAQEEAVNMLLAAGSV